MLQLKVREGMALSLSCSSNQMQAGAAVIWKPTGQDGQEVLLTGMAAGAT